MATSVWECDGGKVGITHSPLLDEMPPRLPHIPIGDQKKEEEAEAEGKDAHSAARPQSKCMLGALS